MITVSKRPRKGMSDDSQKEVRRKRRTLPAKEKDEEYCMVAKEASLMSLIATSRSAIQYRAWSLEFGVRIYWLLLG